MTELLVKLKINTDEVKLQKAVYNKRKNSLTVFMLVKNNLSVEDENKIVEELEHKFELSCTIKTKKELLDSDLILYAIKNVIKNKYNNLFGFISLNDISISLTPQLKIIFNMTNDIADIFQKNGFIQDLTKELDEHFFEKFVIEFKIKQGSINEDILIDRQKLIEEEFKSPQKGFFSITGCEKYIGESTLFTKVAAIEDLSTAAEVSVCCGKIKYFTKRTFEKLVKNEKKTKEYFTFTLEDGRSSIACTCFCSEQNKSKLEKLEDGNKVVVVGPVEMFREKLCFKPKSILFCENFVYVEPKKVFHGAALNYKKVFPKPYISLEQVDMLADDDSNKVPEILQNNEFVVFDVETTGLNYLDSEVVEIGAVKIKKGKIVEIFQTLIKPVKYEIGPVTEELTGISSDMVANSPTFEEVISDFYKFCNGCSLVAHNADFDCSFIKNQAEPFGYYFDNPIYDTLAIARSNVHGVKNYKLKTLVDSLNIDLENAHRALNDALATAKLFIVISKYIK